MKPNLQDYNKVYKKFRWKDAEVESGLDFFDKNKTQMNIAYNALTRHALSKNAGKVALRWEGDDGKQRDYTFVDLEKESNRFANLLKKLGIKKGDRCFIFLPKVPELYSAFFGILKIGAVVGTLFPAFGSEGIETRLKRGGVKLLITNNELLERVRETKNLPQLKHIIIIGDRIRRTRKTREKRKAGKIKRWEELSYDETKKESSEFETVKTSKDDDAIMLFTSATAGTPVAGIVLPHKSLIHQTLTARWVLDLHHDDIYWCTADPGWITGIVYGIIAPFTLGITSVAYEGRFDVRKWYEIMEKNKVSVLYTAPTAIRMLMAADTSAAKNYDFSALRHICSVGETLNPAAVKWCKKIFNQYVYDTYWQTETGAIVMANYRCLPIRLGSMGKPVPGITAKIMDEKKNLELGPGKIGVLALAPNWPALMSKIWKHPELYKSYFIKDRKGKKWYLTKDLAYSDKHGYYFFVGRADEVIKTSGERINPFEVENVLLEHKAIAEAAVIGKPDPLRGEIIVAFIVLKKDYATEKAKEKLKEDIVLFVKKKLAGHAYPREIYFIPELPKTRSGKIMRLVLKSIIKGEQVNIAAVSNPKCIKEIKKALRL